MSTKKAQKSPVGSPSSKTDQSNGLKDEKDPRLEIKILHEDILKTIFANTFMREKPFIQRSDLERLAMKAPLSIKKVKEKRKTEIVRSVINVLLALGILESDSSSIATGDDPTDVKIRANVDQARVLENVDHYTHALLMLQEYEDKLVREEMLLVEKLIARGRGAKNNPITLKQASQVESAAAAAALAKPVQRSHKRRKSTADPLDLASAMPEPAPTPPSDFGEDALVISGDGTSLGNLHAVAERARLEQSVERIRQLQLLLHTPGAKFSIEKIMSSHPDKPKFNPTALGPLAPGEMQPGARESRGSALVHAKGGPGESRPVTAAVLGGSSQLPESGIARVDAVNGLRSGYEVELKTKPLDFGEIAAQFDVWNGQDSELGVSGRSSPRPAQSPGAESLPVPTPSPPMSSPERPGHQQNFVVRVPQCLKLSAKELQALSEAPSDDLSDDDLDEERRIADYELLKMHDACLEEFRINYEKEQEAQKQKKKESREAGERQAREVVAAARARASSQVGDVSLRATVSRSTSSSSSHPK